MHPRSGDVLEGGNINLGKRPVVKNKDGSISTVRSMSFSPKKGVEILVPTVEATGKGILSNRGAMEQYGRTKQHLGKFKTPEAATKYAERLHRSQEKRYAAPKRSK